MVRRRALRLWKELLRIGGVGNRGHVLRVQPRTENGIFASASGTSERYAPRVAHADDVVNVREREAKQLVRQHTADVRKAEQRVVGEHRFEPEALGVEYALSLIHI